MPLAAIPMAVAIPMAAAILMAAATLVVRDGTRTDLVVTGDFLVQFSTTMSYIGILVSFQMHLSNPVIRGELYIGPK